MWGEPRAGLGDAGRALGVAGDEGRFLGPGLQMEREVALAVLRQPLWRWGRGLATLPGGGSLPAVCCGQEPGLCCRQ